MFEHALTTLGVAASSVIHVGDDLVDVEGALGVGMRAVRIATPGCSMRTELL
ncbi:MAG TPA: HAD hydrolase-like protein [Dehalococcoidia bacterium]|nr:hypothetical protein [Chloroflexota bacterium]HJP27541.1 HAD hydrolase-like protein [Dehalococcoidia bacterium]